MAGRNRVHKITGDRTDPQIISLLRENNKIFRRARIINTKESDKKPLAAELILDQNSKGLLFTRNSNNRKEVCGFCG